MIDFDADTINAAKIVGYTIATVGAALYGNSVLRRRLSGDRVQIRTDDGEVSLLDRQQNEIEQLRARADQATEERNRAVSEMGALREKVLNLTYHIERLELQIGAMQKQLSAFIGSPPA